MKYEIGEEWFMCNKKFASDMDDILTFCKLTNITYDVHIRGGIENFPKTYIYVHFRGGNSYMDVYIYITNRNTRRVIDKVIGVGNPKFDFKDYRKIRFEKEDAFFDRIKKELVVC